MSELKVLISDSMFFTSDQIAIAVVLQHNHDERSLLQFDDGGFANWVPVERGTQTKPTFALTNDVARALLDSLMRHYQGASDMHTVRSDLLHERGRVDKLVAALIESQDHALSLALGE